MNPALFRWKKVYSTPYVANSVIPVELTKYLQADFIEKIMVQITGTINTGSATAGTATGRTNPEDLLINATLQTSPTVLATVPVNQVSGRGLFIDRALDDGCFRKSALITDAGGSQTVNCSWVITLKRKGLRQAIEYGLDSSRYTGLLLSLTFGDQTRLFTGSSNSWSTGTSSLSSLTVNIFVKSGFIVAPKMIHAHEIFEQNFPVLQTQSDFLINQLPSGFIYTDLCFLMEQNNLLTAALLNNIDIEGGGRVWLQSGEGNADEFQRTVALSLFDGTASTTDDPTKNTNSIAITGIYPISMKQWGGMYSRMIDALTAQIIAKMDVTYASGTQNIRLVGRRMIPGAVYQAATPPPAASGKTVTVKH